MSDERRKQGRVPTVIDLVWEGAAAKYEARTSDLNTEGCFIDHIGNVTIGEIITFKLRLPAEDWIELQAEAVYAFPSTGFGVRFTNVSEAARKRLEWLVKAEAYRAERGGDAMP
jgi:hypothetical protein